MSEGKLKTLDTEEIGRRLGVSKTYAALIMKQAGKVPFEMRRAPTGQGRPAPLFLLSDVEGIIADRKQKGKARIAKDAQ